MVRFIKDNGLEIRNMVMVFKYGQMEPVTKDIGSKIKHVEKVNFGM
jgi:hypothetical protein